MLPNGKPDEDFLQARRLVILGCCGSGKSYLAERIATATGLPLFRLDDLYWGENWSRPHSKIWLEQLQAVVDKPDWIIDGNYLDSIDVRLAKADAAVVFDLPTFTCLCSVVIRDLRRFLGFREDLPLAVKKNGDSGFGRIWSLVWKFRSKIRPRLIEKLDDWGGPILVIRRRTEARRLVWQLHQGLSSTVTG